jgi:fluoride exporter
MDIGRALAIAAGGIVGAAVRWAIVSALTSDGLVPWPVLGLNVAGSVALGALLAEEAAHPRARLWLHDVGGIGFCGGLTTFSTFTFEIVELIRQDDAVVAMFYGTSSVVLSIGGVLAGAAVFHRVRAAGLPLEERP